MTAPDLGKPVPLAVLARVTLRPAQAIRFDLRAGTWQYFHVAFKALRNLVSTCCCFPRSPAILSIMQSPFRNRSFHTSVNSFSSLGLQFPYFYLLLLILKYNSKLKVHLKCCLLIKALPHSFIHTYTNMCTHTLPHTSPLWVGSKIFVVF